MHKKTIHNLVLTALAVMAVIIISGCKSERPQTPPFETVRVTTEPLGLAEVTDYIDAVGTVETADEAVLSTKLMGTVKTISVDEGDRVKAGQVVAKIDASDVVAKRAEATSAKTEAEAAKKEAGFMLENIEVNLHRMRGLYDEGAVTKKELDDITAQHQAALAGIERIEAGIARAQAGIAQADSMLGYATVISPVDGYVISKAANVGETASPGMPLLKVAGLDRLRLAASVSESEAAAILPGSTASVTVDALGKDAMEGTVSEVVPEADPMSRTITVKVALGWVEGLRPGMFARVRFPAGAREAAVVPESALIMREGIAGVFVVGDDGVISFRSVLTGERTVSDGGRVEVVSGLGPGETVVTGGPGGGLDGVRDGMKAVR